MEVFRNRLISEYTRDELEELFLVRCDQLDQKASEIAKLEQKASDISGKLTRIKQDINDTTKQRVKFDGKLAPTAYRVSQVAVKELKDQIAELEIELGKKNLEKDAVAREVAYFKSLLNFPAKLRTDKSSKFNPTKTIEDLLAMLADLSSRNTDPLVVNRLLAASYILQNNLKAAEEPMRKILELIGESSLPVFESIDMRKEIKEREDQIEKLRHDLAVLQAQQDKLSQEHNDRLKQYQLDAERNQEKYRELMDLHHKKEKMEADAARLAELEIIADGLRKEIELLKQQRDKLIEDNADRKNKLRDELQKLIDQMQKELEDLKAHIDALRKSNAEIENQKNSLQQTYENALEKRADTIDGLNKLQEEYRALRARFVKLMSGTNEDPFENQRFIDFINGMIERNWSFNTVRKYLAHIESIDGKLEQLDAKIAKYQPIKEQLTKQIADKTRLVKELEAELDARHISHAGAVAEAQRTEFKYQNGASHINITAAKQFELEENQTAIILSFLEFTLDKSFLGSQNCKLFLTVDFYDCKQEQTNFIDKFDTTFNTDLLFKVKNDFILRDYLKDTKIPVKLWKATGMKFTEVANTTIAMFPFLDGVPSFSASSVLMDKNEKPVGNINYEAQIYIPLLQ
ncbi:hypothetical protein TVAG_478880 [Trichomonas vaginalis G3]|uniref:RPGR-interacting protein 1 first C2 domain-containing protein n=1 Tax=Trichomonas vaginalis (strain ATCC PRA-98 / G3) TaxID=412133 RepID=A2E004_TRIV3|nr:retinitis pigmentosa GTPase regulator-interacting protein family [Trichomonas vaginalis G3]EAY14063.1 hypothetical protein TVAG_478880 [Trichomonas vaginalis G3]KAI5519496.1 retinitis pigmentosa GTPase regulator-interacting protein family [Trichomonas vaginalis G3]|eukprot:XP_001326286.1 hypothetical protein [Trichomonas vaginalis G3]